MHVSGERNPAPDPAPCRRSVPALSGLCSHPAAAVMPIGCHVFPDPTQTSNTGQNMQAPRFERPPPTRTYRSLACPGEQAGSLERRTPPGPAAAAAAASRVRSSIAHESVRRTSGRGRGGRPSLVS